MNICANKNNHYLGKWVDSMTYKSVPLFILIVCRCNIGIFFSFPQFENVLFFISVQIFVGKG